jgi:hypothetical protein
MPRGAAPTTAAPKKESHARKPCEAGTIKEARAGHAGFKGLARSHACIALPHLQWVTCQSAEYKTRPQIPTRAAWAAAGAPTCQGLENVLSPLDMLRQQHVLQVGAVAAKADAAGGAGQRRALRRLRGALGACAVKAQAGMCDSACVGGWCACYRKMCSVKRTWRKKLGAIASIIRTGV